MATVLVVDDDASVLSALRSALARAAHAPIAASSAAEAVRAIEWTDPSVGLFDLRMPAPDGIDAFIAVRRLRPRLRGLLMSAFAPTETEWDRAFRAGVAGWLQKPFRVPTLLGRIDEICVDVDGKVSAITYGRELVSALTGPRHRGRRAQEREKGPLAIAEFTLAVRRLERRSSAASVASNESAELRAIIITVLLARDVSIPLFWVAALCFRVLVSAPERWEALTPRCLAALSAGLDWSPPADPRLHAAIAMIEDLAAHGVRPGAADVADSLILHPSSVGRLLHASSGLGFREWLWAAEMRRAAVALATTDAAVKAIAQETGFAGSGDILVTSFDRTFEAVFGVPPTAFRQICRCRR